MHHFRQTLYSVGLFLTLPDLVLGIELVLLDMGLYCEISVDQLWKRAEVLLGPA